MNMTPRWEGCPETALSDHRKGRQWRNRVAELAARQNSPDATDAHKAGR